MWRNFGRCEFYAFIRPTPKLILICRQDMGLGKTTQIVSRIVDYKMKEDDDAKRKENKKFGKATLYVFPLCIRGGTGRSLHIPSVVCPASVVTQWQAEMKKMAPSLRVLAHHGASRSKGALAPQLLSQLGLLTTLPHRSQTALALLSTMSS